MGSEPQDWLALVAQVEKGDRVALARLSSLVTNYLARFGAYAYRDSWDDVCQEVLVKLVRSVREGKIRNPGAFVGFTGSIVRNTLVDWIRKNGKGGAADGPSDPEVAARQLESLEATTGRPDPDVLMDLGKAVTELPEVQRRVVTALYLEGRSYEEASQDLGIPLGTLKRHQTQGLKALREGLLCAGDTP